MEAKRLRAALLAALGLVGLTACGDKLEAAGGGPDTAGVACEQAAWSAGIGPLFEANCTRCHASTREGAARNGAPTSVNFDAFDAARASAERANARVQAGSMPPGGGLAGDDRALLQTWLDLGTPEEPDSVACEALGDPTDAGGGGDAAGGVGGY